MLPTLATKNRRSFLYKRAGTADTASGANPWQGPRPPHRPTECRLGKDDIVITPSDLSW